MNKHRQLRLELLDSIRYNEDGVDRNVISKQPYTYVEVTVFDIKTADEAVIGHGFSKVCHPDIFDWQTGVDRATERAVEHVVEQMV